MSAFLTGFSFLFGNHFANEWVFTKARLCEFDKKKCYPKH